LAFEDYTSMLWDLADIMLLYVFKMSRENVKGKANCMTEKSRLLEVPCDMQCVYE